MLTDEGGENAGRIAEHIGAGWHTGAELVVYGVVREKNVLPMQQLRDVERETEKPLPQLPAVITAKMRAQREFRGPEGR
ncbi:MAG: hypothetical protein A3F68_01940 [Acidobacteria bacterium RIFCSPLOWO2_12_FULL_54_10]|nr:MAG: hypothetical protein A3F68_01940 [Acidobacteria bacterium RIFCSPLOWO2_12_FULL_54_10]